MLNVHLIYTKIYHSKAFQNIQKGILGLKLYHLATWQACEGGRRRNVIFSFLSKFKSHLHFLRLPGDSWKERQAGMQAHGIGFDNGGPQNKSELKLKPATAVFRKMDPGDDEIQFTKTAEHYILSHAVSLYIVAIVSTTDTTLHNLTVS
jgi:hypothetical protein